MPAPLEVLAAPLEVYLAPVGTAFPLIDAAPAAAWVKLGTRGDEEYAEEGVTVTHEQTIEKFRGAGTTGAIKAWRTAEELLIAFTLHDITLEQYSQALNDLTVTDTAAGAGTAGFRSMNLRQGGEVAQHALLARGKSPYGDTFNGQYQVPVVIQQANPAPVFRKGQPAGLAFTFAALEDLTAATEGERFGKLIFQDAAPV